MARRKCGMQSTRSSNTSPLQLSGAPEPPADHSVWPWVEPAEAFAGAPAPAGGWPRITIVTPNFNYGHMIERTMRSVLQQRYPALEYIVVDDGSTDASVDVIRRYADRLAHWSHRPNQGQYASVNEGFRRGTGEVMAWLDSDDVYLPWTLWCVARIFAQLPEVQWITGHPVVFQDGVMHHVQKRRPFPRELIRAGRFHGTPGGLGWIPQEHMFWRRSLWERAGELRTQLTVGADYDMNVRFAEHAELYVTSTVLGGFSARPGLNRGTLERPQYVVDIRGVIREIRARGVRPPAGVGLYERVKRVPGVRRLVKHVTGVHRLTGPILQWDFRASAYRVERVPFFE